MADVYVNALTTISTEPSSTDSIVCVNRNTNEGQIIDYSLLADKILDKITSKTYSGLNTNSKLLVGAINEVGLNLYNVSGDVSDMQKNTLPSSANVDISSYTSANYTTPADGYVFLYNVSPHNGYVQIGGNTSIGGAAGRFSVFIRKGMTLRVNGDVDTCRFVSLT